MNPPQRNNRTNNNKQQKRKPRARASNTSCLACGMKFPTVKAVKAHIAQVHTKSQNRPSPRAVVYDRSSRRGMLAGNPTDAKLIESFIGRRGGGHWALRALDPCGEVMAGPTRIPDATIGSTAALEYVFDSVISAPAGVAATDEWDCMILSVPFPEMPFWVFYRKTGDPWATHPNLIISPQGLTASSVHPIGGANPFLMTTDGPTLGEYGNAYRTTSKGFSVVFDSSDLYNQGRVYAGSIRTDVSHRSMIIEDGATPPVATDYSADVLVLDKIPEDVGALQSACSEYVRYRATDGIYVPSRFNQSEHKYVPTQWGKLPLGTDVNRSSVLHPVEFGTVDSDGGIVAGPNFITNSFGDWRAVSGQDNTQLGVAMFLGMSGAANLDIKGTICMEVEPAPGSPWYPVAQPAPLPDKEAIEEFFIVQNQLQVGYPERYNSFGALIPLLAQAVAGLANWGIGAVTKWVTSKYSGRRKPVDIPVD
jgi:hypothetical protein